MLISFFKKLHGNNPRLSKDRSLELKLLCKRLGIRFRIINLLDLSLTHRSISNKSNENNERLEFLGDSVLSLSVTEFLYTAQYNKKEGDLAKIKSYVVSEEVLSKIALNIGLDKCLRVGKGEEHSGGRKKNAILEDALESLFGAYYLDRGYKKAKKLVLSLLVPEIELVLKGDYRKDYKTIFQELIQKKYKVCPKYSLREKKGPDHDIVFVYNVLVNNEILGVGSGKSRKQAEQNAAKKALESSFNFS